MWYTQLVEPLLCPAHSSSCAVWDEHGPACTPSRNAHWTMSIIFGREVLRLVASNKKKKITINWDGNSILLRQTLLGAAQKTPETFLGACQSCKPSAAWLCEVTLTWLVWRRAKALYKKSGWVRLRLLLLYFGCISLFPYTYFLHCLFIIIMWQSHWEMGFQF